jgi:dienelactone hydrolase
MEKNVFDFTDLSNMIIVLTLELERRSSMVINYLSNSIVKGGQAPVFGSPKDFGLDYEDVTFNAKDGVTLSGWLVRGGEDKIVIQSHYGVQSSRSGYTPDGKGMPKMWNEEISFLKHVKYLVDKGYSVLMYDFRNHGNSGEGTCPWVTWGPEEHKDVLAAVDFISTHPDYADSKIGLLSICMGAASSTYAFGKEDGLRNYENLKAMIAIQPLIYPDFITALGLNNFIGRRVTKRNIERTGIDLNTTSFIPNVEDISVPTLLVQNSNDEYLNRETIEKYYDHLRVEKEMMWLDLGNKRAAGYDYLTKHPEKILDFFDKHLG